MDELEQTTIDTRSDEEKARGVVAGAGMTEEGESAPFDMNGEEEPEEGEVQEGRSIGYSYAGGGERESFSDEPKTSTDQGIGDGATLTAADGVNAADLAEVKNSFLRTLIREYSGGITKAKQTISKQETLVRDLTERLNQICGISGKVERYEQLSLEDAYEEVQAELATAAPEASPDSSGDIDGQTTLPLDGTAPESPEQPQEKPAEESTVTDIKSARGRRKTA